MASDGPDSTVSDYKRILGELDSVVGGVMKPDGGGGHTWEAKYSALEVPPVLEKLEMVQAASGGQIQPRVTVDVTKEDQAIIQKKLDVRKQAELDEKFFNIYKPFEDPMKYAFYRRVYPEPFERMKKTLEEKADLQKKVMTKMLDEVDKEQILFNLAMTERPEVQSYILGGIGPTTPDAANTAATTDGFKRGLLNPYRVFEMHNMASQMQSAATTVPPVAVGAVRGIERAGLGGPAWGTWVPAGGAANAPVVGRTSLANLTRNIF